MPIRVVRRKDTGALTISGTVKLPNGSRVRVRARAGSDNSQLAEEEARALEARILRDAYHGERRGARSFSEAVVSYVESKPRSPDTTELLNRLLRALGDMPLSAIDQTAVVKARRAMLAPGAKPATFARHVIIPLRAVMMHAHRLKWCDAPTFEVPRQASGRTSYLFPAEADRLIAAAAPHLRPLLILLLATGARLGEALDLDWRDTDLRGARVIFWRTKSGKRRDAALPPVAVAALANLPYRAGPVILTHHGEPYGPRESGGGSRIKTAWNAALRRAGLDPALTPHDLRHSWASWHYAAHRDLLKLMAEGGWASVAMVTRYAHLLPAGHEAEIQRWWHGCDTAKKQGSACA